MSDSIRIRTTPNGSDKYLKVNLEQDFDFIEILSLKISQEDAYRKFCSDYGVIVGRVIINNGFGVPNAKVSVFIPLDEIDKNNPEIKGLYPFEVITDKDSDGIRYNLLPKNGDPTNICSTPVGTFPNKREVLDNSTMLEVYCKYYKFTTTTNHAGDFMLFGVPLGTYTVHLDADISDIGIASQRPYDLISQGTPTKLFDSPTKFKSDKNLDKLVQIKTMNAGVNVQPFWGDTENCELGITRLDFDLNYSLVPSAIFMGSIFGDQDKHSINKKCRPRRKLGNLCEQTSGGGSIDMIRKTLDGQIEDFSVDGGRVIDDYGNWSYQIPMNLDYMVTNEEGDLISSQDPNAGIPTRASVRFSVSMDETGGEGRLRTRAKYLVPNNPLTQSEIDYEFGPATKNSSFRDLYWNKIYTVNNFIPRFQTNGLAKTRSFTGIKDVDACDKNPFPYNRVNTTINPLFFIICLIIKIMSFLIYVMNKFLIYLMNLIIDLLNAIIQPICNAINKIIDFLDSVSSLLGGNGINNLSCPRIEYIPCIFVQCPSDDGKLYAPGCSSGSNGYAKAVSNASSQRDETTGDSLGPNAAHLEYTGLDDCLAFQMAKSLNMFQFDFYNDWINGSLYSYLLKYKKKRKGKEKFCEYDCSGESWASGVDGNNDGNPDNNCHNNFFVDVCYGSGDNLQDEKQTNLLREGLIKKNGDQFYYASTTHDSNYKLFATDLVNLGSIFDCDWQGIPKLQKLLIPTTYKIPNDTDEEDDNGIMESCGMINTNTGHEDDGLFFSINCIGLHVDKKQCLNIRHICEMGVDLDKNDLIPPDCIIDVNNIDNDGGVLFRDVFYNLNKTTTMEIPFPVLPPINGTSFNTIPAATYNFSSSSDNGPQYASFRDYVNDTSYNQPKHSYFFYFGINDGNTGLEKMNQNFFTECKVINNNEFILKASSSPTGTNSNTGIISFFLIDGVGPYTYIIAGINGVIYSNSGSVPKIVSGQLSDTTTITGLAAGSYLITVTDSIGYVVTQNISVSEPPPLTASVSVRKNATSNISTDGELMIDYIAGGTGPYTYVLTSPNGSLSPSLPATPNLIITGLDGDNINSYILTITDSLGATDIINNLIVGEPLALTVASTMVRQPNCFNDNDGEISILITGGRGPFTIRTTGPNTDTNSTSIVGLTSGVYNTSVIDAQNNTASDSVSLTSINPQLGISLASSYDTAKQCDPNNYNTPFIITNGVTSGPVNVQYLIDGNSWVDTVITYAPQMILTIPSNQLNSQVRIRFKNSNSTCYSNEIVVLQTSMELPPNTLSITPDTSFNTKQCTVGSVTFRFNISHLVRAPYTATYSINGGPQQNQTISSNPTTITSSVVGNVANIVLSVTDNKGCVANSTFSITIPTVNLNGSITRSGGVAPYTYTVTGNGGIGAIIGTGIFTSNNTTYTTTIIDSVGCTKTLTY